MVSLPCLILHMEEKAPDMDQIRDATETAEHTSLSVLPALMLRARKESS
jgi:hypothetical protein